MKKLFISLRPDPPEGFEYRTPTKRDLLSNCVALFADSMELILTLLNDFSDRVYGVVITKGDTFSCTPIGPGLWHLLVTKQNLLRLHETASIFLNLMIYIQKVSEKSKKLKIELNRTKKTLKQTQDAYSENAERLRKKVVEIHQVFEHSQVGIFRTDLLGNLLLANPAILRIMKYTSLDAINKIGLTNTYEHPSERKRLIELTKHGPVESFETRIVRGDGEIIDVALNTYPVLGDDGQLCFLEGNLIDITEQKKTEKSLLRAEQERLKFDNLEMIGVLAGGIAHDFNNLLTGVFGNMEMAKSLLTPDHRAYDFLESAGQSMERATNLTNQLLTFSKGGDPIKENLSIAEIITETAEFSIRGSKSKLLLDLAPDLWLIDADRGQISQVISNLVINAHQAMPTGGIIRIGTKNIKISNVPHVQITVQDEGIGIAPKYIDKIFDPYFTTKQKGSGLGLAITHSIVSKHNGRINVDSQLDQGTTFIISFPAAVETTDMITEKKLVAINSKPITSASILVLEDEETVRDVTAAMLERAGFEVSFAMEGQEAINKYRKFFERGTPFDVVITDLTIPGGMGGMEAAKKILRIDSNAKIIISSGYATDPAMANYKRYGFKGVVTKPYRFKTLHNIIHQILTK